MKSVFTRAWDGREKKHIKQQWEQTQQKHKYEERGKGNWKKMDCKQSLLL